MKLSVIIFCLFLSVNALGQTSDTTKNPLYVVDGQPDAPVTNVKPADILTISSIINSADAVKLYGPKAINGANVIISKKYGTAAYQTKFAALSKKYKDYMDLKHTDANLMYVLDNVIMNQQRKSAILALYELSPDSIDKITFKKDSHFKTDATVEITTRKDN
jgi:hypothetical protein